MPVGRQKQTGKDALEVVHTVLHAGGKFGGGGYKVSGGLHGVGVSVVNALSEHLTVESVRDGKVYCQEYVRGQPTGPVTAIGPARDRRGTTTTFQPDPEVFETVVVSFDTIAQRLRESAYLTKGVHIRLVDERVEAPREKSFYFEGGLTSFVRHLNKGKDVLNLLPIAIERRDGPTQIEVAIQYNDSFSETVLAFANNINTVDGGTHVTGFRAALTTSLNDWARRQGVIKDSKCSLSGDDVREGLTAVVSVKLTDPQFEGQTKAKLGNAEVKGQVQTAVGEGISRYLDEHPGGGAPHHRQVAHGRPRPRGGAQGARPRHPQERPGGLGVARQARRLPGTRPRAQRALHRRGRLGRWVGQAGPRPTLAGDPADVRQDAQRREGTPRQGALEREDPAAHHRARAPASARRSTSPSCATTRSSCWPTPTSTAPTSARCS